MTERMPDPQSKTFIGEIVHLYVQEVLRDYPALREHAKFREFADAHAQNLVMMLTTWCLGGHIPSRTEEIIVECPDGAWQMFKYLHMPRWFIGLFPVAMKCKTVQTAVHHYFVCPHLVTDPYNHHVQFMATGTNLARMFRG